MAGAFLGPAASDAERADLLGEMFRAARLYADLSRGMCPARGAVPPRFQAMANLAVVLAAAVRRYRASASAAASPAALPAGFEVPAGLVERGLEPGAWWASDEI